MTTEQRAQTTTPVTPEMEGEAPHLSPFERGLYVTTEMMRQDKRAVRSARYLLDLAEKEREAGLLKPDLAFDMGLFITTQISGDRKAVKAAGYLLRLVDQFKDSQPSAR
jgi:hypothetical protein